MKAVVIAGGSMHDYERMKGKINPDDYIVCADGGYLHAKRMGLFVHAAVGDFDTVPPPEDPAIEVIRYSPQKDYSDTYYAVQHAHQAGFSHILLLGATGSRFDHVLANYHLLYHFHRAGIVCTMADETNEIFLAEHSCTIEGHPGDKISLIPLQQDIDHVTTTGLLYPLRDEPLSYDLNRGISNELTENRASIRFGPGILTVIRYREET